MSPGLTPSLSSVSLRSEGPGLAPEQRRGLRKVVALWLMLCPLLAGVFPCHLGLGLRCGSSLLPAITLAPIALSSPCH